MLVVFLALLAFTIVAYINKAAKSRAAARRAATAKAPFVPTSRPPFIGSAPPPQEIPSSKLNVPMLLRYRDADGFKSDRRVDVHGSDGTHLQCLCHLRHDVRTFAIDRIECAFDPATGEAIEDVRAYLAAHGGPSAIEHEPAAQRTHPARPARKLHIPVPVLLDYRDADGVLTERLVDVADVTKITLSGYCQETQRHRTFRFDRVKGAADPETGKAIDDLAGYLRERL